MNRNITKLAVGISTILLMSSSAQAGYTIKNKINDTDTKLSIFGFSQLEMRGGEGSAIKDNDSAISFHAQRIRLGWKYSAGKIRSKVFLDFNQNSAANKTTDAGGASGIGVPDNIKDAFIAYNYDKAFTPKMGVIKMPHGMSFTMPGWNLDIAERGLDKKLVLERNLGLMISGRDIGFGNYAKVNGYEMGHERAWKGFGYDIMVANQAGRSAAVTNAKEGNGNSYAARVMFDWTEVFHLEASAAMSENAGGIDGQTTYSYVALNGTIPAVKLTANTSNYYSYDIGFDSSFMDGGNVKAEYIYAHNVKGKQDHDETALSLSAQYAINNVYEPTIKHIQGSETSGTSAQTHNLGNTYLGLNIYLEPFNAKMDRNSKRNRNAHKLVLNYIVATGDTSTWAPTAGGGYKKDAWIMQWQVKF